MSAEPDGGEWAFASQDTSRASFVAYANETWVLVQTVDSGTPYVEDTKVFTSDNPEDGWTLRITVSDYRAGDSNAINRVVFGDGKWVVASGNATKLLVIEADFSSYSLENVPGTLTAYDIAYGDGYWLCAADTLFAQPPRLYYATSPAGGWTWINPSNLNSVTPTTVAFNGERWVAAGNIPGVGPGIVTTTDPTSTWTSCTLYNPDSNLFGPNKILWFSDLNQWFMGWANSVTTTLIPRYAEADAADWVAIGYDQQVGLPGGQMVAVGDGYIVHMGRYTSGFSMRTTYIAATSFADTGTATVIDSSNNTSTDTSPHASCITYGDGKFVIALKPSTKSTYGTVTSPYEEGGAGWGLVL